MKSETMEYLVLTILILTILNGILIFLFLQKEKPKSDIHGKTLIELLVMAEQMEEGDKLIRICKLIRSLNIEDVTPDKAEGYANIIKKELKKIEHVFKI